MTLWGLLTTLNCAPQNYAGLIVLRVLLGCFESAVAPAYVANPGNLNVRVHSDRYQTDSDYFKVVQEEWQGVSLVAGTLANLRKTAQADRFLVFRYWNCHHHRSSRCTRTPLLYRWLLPVLADHVPHL